MGNDENPRTDDRIGRIAYMWEENNKQKFHINWMIKSVKTILGDTGNPKELFETYDCDNLFLSEVNDRVKVTYLPIPNKNWITLGNFFLNEWNSSANSKDEKSFYFQKRYDSTYGRFEDIEIGISENKNFDMCPRCEHMKMKKNWEKPCLVEELEYIESTDEYSYGMVRWRDEELKIGSCVFLKPGTLFPILNKSYNEKVKLKKLDEDRYPEMYRKQIDRTKFEEVAEPFNIGYIVSIHSEKRCKSASDIFLTVKKFYRPQDTHLDEDTVKHLDLNLLYWSEEESVVSFTKVEGKCYVANEKNLKCSTDEWSQQGPYRFYYKNAYDHKNKSFSRAPTTITRYYEDPVTRRKSNIIEEIIEENPVLWPTISRPLRCLDIFAGCGGLTEGLHQAGIAECRWAIEKEEAAAHSFRLNYPEASVFTEDCNELLKFMMNGKFKKNGQYLPQKGEVELLCGGPPCQGFSGMNRFNHLQYSSFKNSLVVSFLSYVDFFRPRFVIMENVRNFVLFKKSIVLKLTLRCLIKMGYQCTFGIVQAGNYGVPQSRRRAIILAAAPGEALPNFPEPMHVFVSGATTLNVDDTKFMTNTKWSSSAPLRMLSVYDAISDLPEIKAGDLSRIEIPHKHDPKTHFQRLIRKSNSGDVLLKDHVCKPMNLLVEKRISFIPRAPGSDWRDLPNIEVKLRNGSMIKKLIYTHHDIKSGKSKQGRLRGVCSCASGGKCKPKYKQNDTLIPWCLPHTANRHGNWSGLYGRIEWDKFFRTVVTQPEPMGKQGKVIHPEENRVISVRESARSQGFPDSFQFFGSISDKYRQIGNAVPPPLALALGLV
uniref:Cytosine-specific methyltransferase n=1 Tax=Phenacoccus solenopsis TaxID=483260 RepID=A0A7H0S4X3_9HEMI|nr:DNA (cytosine-5)-methyltransferase 1 [Phenacoccus solenopsis]